MASKESRYARQHTSTISNNLPAAGPPPVLQPPIDYEGFAQLIRKELKKEIKKQSRKSLWQNTIVEIILFLLGVIVTLLIYIVGTLQK